MSDFTSFRRRSRSQVQPLQGLAAMADAAAAMRDAVFGARDLPNEVAGRLRAAQVSSTLRMTPFMMAANIISIVVVLLVFWDTGYDDFLAIWGVGFALFIAVAMRQWWASYGMPPPARVSRRAVRRVVMSCAIPALFWGMAPVMLFDSASAAGQLLISSLVLGTLSAGAFGLATVAGAAFLYTGIIAAAGLVGLAMGGHAIFLTIGILLMIYLLITWFAIGWFAHLFNAATLHAMEIESQKELVGLLLHDFQENASDWLWEIDAEGRVTMISPRLLDLTGLPEDQVIGQSFVHVLGKQADEASLSRTCEVFGARKAFASVEVPVSVNGRNYWWSLTGKPIFDSKGDFAGYRGVGSNITAEKLAHQQMVHVAHHDALTDLPNRILFQERLERARREREDYALLYIDLDHFKTVNDTLGHAAGDAILVEVAQRLIALKPDDALICRLGGDEFALVWPRAQDEFSVEALARAIVGQLSQPFQHRGQPVHLGASIGAVLAPRDGADPADLLRRADLALYAAKSDGRGRARFFAQKLEDDMVARRALEEDLRAAVATKGLSLAFQPIVDLKTGEISGAEALLRWTHPVRGNVPPSLFVPIAEETGLIVEIGEWVLRRACEEAKDWPAHMTVAVNVSAAQMAGHRLPLAIAETLFDTGLDGKRLEIEITESMLADTESAERLIAHLRAFGIRLSLDDFGTGYSSLAYLRKFPFDKIKIDQSFVREAVRRPDCAAIVGAVASLARELGMSTVAEGIETTAELAIVRAAGCPRGQGYHFGRPMPPEQFRDLVVPGQRAA
jgi:diguanylate cyclase (GGDEF)-like protein/PAS domain S-box-containing protein